MPDDRKAQNVYRIEELDAVHAPDYVSVYANNTKASSSFYDLRLNFGQVTVGPNETPIIEEHASVTMTWEHVRALRDLLTRLLLDYEASNGSVRKPTDQPAPQTKTDDLLTTGQ
jgi:hypothetical protein